MFTIRLKCPLVVESTTSGSKGGSRVTLSLEEVNETSILTFSIHFPSGVN